MVRKWIGLILQWMVAAVLAPFVWTLAKSLAESLASVDMAIPYRLIAVLQGVSAYLIVHLAFWKPKPVYLLGHRLLQRLVLALLGGQVGTLPAGGQGTEAPPKSAKSGPPKEQVLAAVSPALVPVYALLLALGLGLVRSTTTLVVDDRLICLAMGVVLALHLVMAVDTLQETRPQQTFVAYLLTLEFMTLATCGIALLCFAFLLPDIAVGPCLQRAFQDALQIATTAVNALLY